MGLHVEIYRRAPYAFAGASDCTNGGISATAKGLCLVNVEGPFEPCDDYPAAMLVPHTCFGDEPGRRMVKIVPEGETRWTMFGGNYAATSDSRFNRAVEQILGVEFFHGAVCIHDRIEA